MHERDDRAEAEAELEAEADVDEHHQRREEDRLHGRRLELAADLRADRVDVEEGEDALRQLRVRGVLERAVDHRGDLGAADVRVDGLHVEVGLAVRELVLRVRVFDAGRLQRRDDRRAVGEGAALLRRGDGVGDLRAAGEVDREDVRDVAHALEDREGERGDDDADRDRRELAEVGDERDVHAVPHRLHHRRLPGGLLGERRLEDDLRDEERGEHRGRDARDERHREAADEARADDEEDHAREDGRDVAVEDRREGALVARHHGREAGPARLHLLARALVDEDVGVHRHADGEQQARDAGQRQHRQAHQRAAGERRVARHLREQARGHDRAERQQDEVEHHREVGHEAHRAVVEEHEEQDRRDADEDRELRVRDRVLAEGRVHEALAEHLERGGHRAGVEHALELRRLGERERAGDDGVAAGDRLLEVGVRVGDAVQDDRHVAARASVRGGVLARHLRELLRADAVEGERHDRARHVVLRRARAREVRAGHLGLALDVERAVDLLVGALDAVLLQEEDLGRARVAEAPQRARVGRGDLLVADVPVAGAAHLVADRRLALREEVGALLVVVRRHEVELEERRGLDHALGLLALLGRRARDLHVDAAVLALRDDGLLRAERVDAVADDLDGRLVRRGDRLVLHHVDVGLRGVGVLLLEARAELLAVELEREARAAVEVEAQADLAVVQEVAVLVIDVHRRDAEVDRGDGEEKDDEPFPPELRFHVRFGLLG